MNVKPNADYTESKWRTKSTNLNACRNRIEMESGRMGSVSTFFLSFRQLYLRHRTNLMKTEPISLFFSFIRQTNDFVARKHNTKPKQFASETPPQTFKSKQTYA